jgi:hypothetical protein
MHSLGGFELPFTVLICGYKSAHPLRIARGFYLEDAVFLFSRW